jgi:Zn-dependent protease
MPGPAELNRLIIMIIPLVFAVTIHEVAHGYVAYRLGDDTARLMGRLTLNPIPHIDILGSILVPIILVLSGSSIVFGWAKPVPVNFLKLREYRKGILLVSAAGVAANLACAIASALVFRLIFHSQGIWYPTFFKVSGEFLLNLMMYSVLINLVLLIFNLIPVPPLDGSKIMAMILPDNLSLKYQQLERYGMVLIFLLLLTGLPGKIISFFLFPMLNILLGR